MRRSVKVGFEICMIEQVAKNKSSLIMKIILHYGYVQWILKQIVFTKVIKNAKLGGLGGETGWFN